MKTLKLTLATAVLGAFIALPITSAHAWGNWGPWGNRGYDRGYNDWGNDWLGDGFGDLFGDADFNFSMHGSGSGRGSGCGRGYNDYRGYNGYGYAPAPAAPATAQ